MKRNVVIGCFLFVVTVCFSQAYFFVRFSDKGNPCAYTVENPCDFLSNRAIERRVAHGIVIDSTDFPVHAAYLDAIQSLGLTLKHTSRWLNGATFLATDTSVMAQVRALPFVVYTQCTKKLSGGKRKISDKLAFTKGNHGTATTQIEMLRIDSLHALNFKGDNIHIAVIDAGFYKLDTNPGFERFRSNGQLLGVRDFVGDSIDIYKADAHGMHVLSTIVGYLPENYMGSAPNASCWLLRTEDVASETLLEIDNWVAAVEFADSAGVDIITSSLGYSTFDDASTNFSYADMNGRTVRNSIVATMAARKGILVLNSAGNEGNKPWRYITTPADADSILTVGSVGASCSPSPFSSFGPSSDGRIKPDVCAMGGMTALINADGYTFSGNGTSFSTPIMAGAVACLWQALPQLNCVEIANLVRQNSSQSEYPDSIMGYGIPDMVRAYYGASSQLSRTETGVISVYPNPATDVVSIVVPAGAVKITITDLFGREIWRSTVGGTCTINCSEWSQGIYFVTVTANHKRLVSKIIKK